MVVLITGISSGFGLEPARLLSQEGHVVYGTIRREVTPLPQVHYLRLDVRDVKAVQQAVQQIIETEGHIDVLVNNAGYGFFGTIETVPLEEARRQVEVNVFGLARLTQLVLPYMRQQKSGRIVNTSSIAGKMVIYMGGWYNVTKYSVEAFSDALRMEMKPFGIDVVMIEPGAIKTDWGIIAARHLKESSADTAYEEIGTQWANNIDWFYKTNMLSKPSVVAKAISRAVNRHHPRARYRIGRFSHFGLFLHNLMPARWWDAMMRQGGKIHVAK